MGDEDLANLIKILTGIKVYILWWKNPCSTETCDSCGNEFGIDDKELVGVFITRQKAIEKIAERTKSGTYDEDDHEIEEEVIQ
jgi:hypothetical protein